VKADEQPRVVASGHGALDGGRPDSNGDGDRVFKDVERQAFAVEGGLIVMKGPAAVVL
jgi:hypothetical protein